MNITDVISNATTTTTTTTATTATVAAANETNDNVTNQVNNNTIVNTTTATLVTPDGDLIDGNDEYERDVIRIVLIGKEEVGRNPFFSSVKQGCEAEAKQLTLAAYSKTSDDDDSVHHDDHQEQHRHPIQCIYAGPPTAQPDEQIIIMRQYVRQGSHYIHGIALDALDDDYALPVIEEAHRAGIPVITFDSDIKDTSKRIAYIGTDNFAFGQALGKLVVQLLPQGGTYALQTSSSPNLMLRVEAVREYLSGPNAINAKYTEVSNSPVDCLENSTLALEQVNELASQIDPQPVDVIIPVGGWPMIHYEPWVDMVNYHLSAHTHSADEGLEIHSTQPTSIFPDLQRNNSNGTTTHRRHNRNITFIVADTFPDQIKAITSGHVHGLVGQDPYKMGAMCVKLLYELHTHHSDNDTAAGDEDHYHIHGATFLSTATTVYGTEFLEMVRVPLNLPDANVNNNYLGSLRILGLTFFAITAALSLAMTIWTFHKRNVRVVVVSQPVFLIMLCFGVLVFISTLLPMSFDDSNVDNHTLDKLCMSVPWLGSLGFTIIFAALFSKICRINKIFKNPHPYRRMKVTQRDIYLPLLVLFGFNVLNLTLWTVLSPLKFQRRVHLGTDGWNRVISTYGTCSSSNATPYIVIMALINVSAVVIANWQAYEARAVQSEFSESKYIAIAMVIILQALLTGVPILFLVREMPQVYYVVLTTMFFIISITILLLVFVPKILAERKYATKIRAEQRKHVLDSMAQMKEKRYGFASTNVNDGSISDHSLDAKANRRESDYNKAKRNKTLAQEILEEDEDVPYIARRFRNRWPRRDLQFNDDSDGMKLERRDFENDQELSLRTTSSGPAAAAAAELLGKPDGGEGSIRSAKTADKSYYNPKAGQILPKSAKSRQASHSTNSTDPIVLSGSDTTTEPLPDKKCTARVQSPAPKQDETNEETGG